MVRIRKWFENGLEMEWEWSERGVAGKCWGGGGCGAKGGLWRGGGANFVKKTCKNLEMSIFFRNFVGEFACVRICE